MKDTHGDTIKVRRGTSMGESVVALDSYFESNPDEGVLIHLPAAKARKLAAKIVAIADEIDPPAPVIVKTPRYALDLSVEEAETLAVILSRIGGPCAGYSYDGATSARTHAASVEDKLRDLGLDWAALADSPEYEIDEGNGLARNAIYFAAQPR